MKKGEKLEKYTVGREKREKKRILWEIRKNHFKNWKKTKKKNTTFEKKRIQKGFETRRIMI